jgi:hypothetical protein
MPNASGSIAYLGAARFQGLWNASNNDATGSGLAEAAAGAFTTLLVSGGYHSSTNLTAAAGDYWQVTGSGATTIDGQSSWGLNDWCIYSGSASGTGKWLKLAFEDTIASIIVGDLSSSSFHMGTQYNRHVVFTSGSSSLSGSDNFTFDYSSNTLNLTGTMHVSGTGITLVGPEAGAVALTLKADQGDDAADTFTISAAANGNTTLAAGADIVLDPGGNNVLPGGDSADDLGADGTAWRKLYVDDIDLNGQGRIDLDTDADTSIRSSADDVVKVEVGGADLVTLDVNGLQLTGSLFVTGSGITVTGGEAGTAVITLKGDQGDDATDTSTITANNHTGLTIASAGSYIVVSSSANAVLPAADSAHDFGRSGLAWRKLYVDDIDLNGQGSISMGGTGRIDLDANDNTSIRASADDIVKIEVGGTDLVTLDVNGLQLTGSLLVSGSSMTLTAPEAGNAVLLLRADQGDDAADVATLSMMEGGGLVISGSAGGLILSGSKLVLGPGTVPDTAVAVSADQMLFIDGDGAVKRDSIADFASGMAGTGLDASSGQLTVDLSEVIASDGANRVLTSDGDGTATAEANLTYDGTTFVIGDDARVNDDFPLYFGTHSDAHIKYREAGDNLLIISGSAAGTVISGNALMLDSVTVASGAIAGPGSYLSVNAGGQVVLASITGSNIPAGAVAVASDEVVFLDADGSLKRETIADLATAMAGTGLNASSGQIGLHFAEIGAVTPLASTDSVMILDNGSGTKRVTVTTMGDYLTAASGGLANSSGQLSISGSNIADGTVAVASDQIIFLDADGSVKRETVADLVSGIASTGLDASSGRLTVDVSDFMSNGVDNRLVTATGTDAMNAEANLTYDGTTFVIGDDARVNDDLPLYFGTNSDASIKYREAGDNLLVVSGSAAGTVVSGSKFMFDTVTVTSGTIAGPGSYLGVNAGGQVVLTASSGGGAVTAVANGADNRIATFSSANALNGEANLTYDGTTFVIGDDARVNDDLPLHFGTNSDASIKYREAGDNLLVISGSAAGTVVSGSTLMFDAVTVASGTIAGPGSYLGVNAGGQVVLTASSGGGAVSAVANGADNRLATFSSANALNGEANLTYDGTTFVIGDDARVNDDLPLYFGTNSDAHIKYNEAVDDFMHISGSSNGIVLSGSTVRVVDKLGIGSSTIVTNSAKTSGILVVEAAAADTTNGLIATFKSADTDYGRINIDNSTANGDTQFTFMSNGSSKWSVGNMGSNETFHIKSGFGNFADDDPFVLTTAGLSINTNFTASKGLLVADDEDLYFGTNIDASIKYREAGDNLLVISGSAAGTVVSGSTLMFDAVTVASGTIAGPGSYLGVNAGGQVVLTASSGGGAVSAVANGADNRIATFSSANALNGEANLTYDGTTFVIGDDARVNDDLPLYFGSNSDAFIKYRESVDDLLVISGSATGLCLSGSSIDIGGIQNVFVTSTKIAGKVGINDFAPKVSLSVVNNYHSPTFENQLSDGQGGGERLIYSPGANDTLTSGSLYFLHTDGTWNQTDADAVATGATQMLGIGIGGSSQAFGVLTRGYYRMPATEILNVPGSGAVDGLPLYVSTTAGHLDFTAPSGNNDFVRIVGYAIDDHTGDVLIYFDPDKTHVVVSA